MDLNEYQALALRTAPENIIADLDLMHGALGVMTEGGEIADVVKKSTFYGKNIDWVNIREEIGDVLWYLALLARAADTDLETIAKTNVAKLAARYPEKFDRTRALKRDLAAERQILERQ